MNASPATHTTTILPSITSHPKDSWDLAVEIIRDSNLRERVATAADQARSNPPSGMDAKHLRRIRNHARECLTDSLAEQLHGPALDWTRRQVGVN